MWVFFWGEMCKFDHFFYYILIDVNALRTRLRCNALDSPIKFIACFLLTNIYEQTILSLVLLQDVFALAHSFYCVKFSHVCRDGNFVAHNIARHAHHVTGFSVWIGKCLIAHLCCLSGRLAYFLIKFLVFFLKKKKIKKKNTKSQQNFKGFHYDTLPLLLKPSMYNSFFGIIIDSIP